MRQIVYKERHFQPPGTYLQANKVGLGRPHISRNEGLSLYLFQARVSKPVKTYSAIECAIDYKTGCCNIFITLMPPNSRQAVTSLNGRKATVDVHGSLNLQETTDLLYLLFAICAASGINLETKFVPCPLKFQPVFENNKRF